MRSGRIHLVHRSGANRKPEWVCSKNRLERVTVTCDLGECFVWPIEQPRPPYLIQKRLQIGSLVFASAFKTNQDLPFSHPLVYGPLLLCFIGLVLFIVVELRWTAEPVIDLRLLTGTGRVALADSIASTGALTIGTSPTDRSR